MPSPSGNAENSAAPEESLVRPFMPELDTLRGIAVLAVLLLHGFYWQYSGLSFGPWAHRFMAATQPGWIGVNLFFVLSGFLITGILLESKQKPYFYRRFYTRRALRILPAYYLLLLVLLLLRSSSAAFVGLSFVYLANITNFFGVACDYGPLWSLAVEEHFYILWPTVVRNVTRGGLAVIAGLIVLCVPGLRALAFALGYRGGLSWYTWFVADGLAAGCLLAIVLRSGVARNQVRNLALILMGSSMFLGVAGQPFGITTMNRILGAALQLSTINAFFGGFLLLFLLAGTSAAKGFVNNPVLRFFGYLSYGLYLNHLLAFRIYDRTIRRYSPELLPSSGHFELVVLRFAIAGSFAVAVAYISRKFFEERFLRLKDSLVPTAVAREGDSVASAGPLGNTHAA